MADIKDLVNTALQVQNIQLGRRAQQEQERQQLASRIALMQTVGSRLSRDAQTQLAAEVEGQGLVGGTDLDNLFAGTAQDPSSMAARGAEEGMANLSPEDMATATREGALQTLMGGGTVDLGTARAAEELGQEDFFSALRSGLGLELNAVQEIDVALRNKGLELQWIDMTQRSALQEAGLEVQMAIAEMDARLGAARLMAEQNGDMDVTAELQVFASLARNLETNRRGMNNTTALAHLETMRTIFSQINAKGYPLPTDLFDEEIESLQGGGGFDPFGWLNRWWQGRQREGNR